LLSEKGFKDRLEFNLSLILGENKPILNELEDVFGFLPAYRERDILALVETDDAVFIEGGVNNMAKNDHIQETEKANNFIKVSQVGNMVWKI
jgi:hypothetical protein